MKFIGIVGALVIILALTLPAYAETQSVKISGDITIRGIHRREFDLDKNQRPNIANMSATRSDNFIMTTTEVQIDADLTENVSTCIRIVNQRNWGDSDYKEVRYVNALPFVNDITMGHSLLDLGIDLAYVQIKELFFEPLTIKIGRQDLWFGRGLVIGANQVDPGFIGATMLDNLGAGLLINSRRGIGSPELTAFNSFDAIRATIDFEQYAPLVVDLVYAKIDENAIGPENDIDLYGINAGYTWDVYNAEAEAYYWLRYNKSVPNSFTGGNDNVHSVGMRGDKTFDSDNYEQKSPKAKGNSL